MAPSAAAGKGLTMPAPSKVYTYQGGKKIVLEKRPDQLVVRALPEDLRPLGITDAEQVSSGSSRVTTRAPDLEPLMARARVVAPTHHAYYLADTGEEFLITDRVLVTFRGPMRPEEVDAFTARYGLVTLEAYSDRDYLFQLTDHTGINPVKLVVQLNESEPQVERAEHDLNRRAKPYQPPLPTDPAYARQWHLHTRVTDPQFDPRASSRCEEAWQLLTNFGRADVVVGITDDGCRLDHTDFGAPDKFAGWGYFQGMRLVKNGDIDADRAGMYDAGANHGTSCAGVIAAETDGALTVGGAPGCRLLPVKWESSGPSLFISDSKMLTVLGWVADKIDVLSNSWGNAPTNVWSTTVTNRLGELARTGGRRGRGIVFLWAAGNENCPIQHTASVDVPYSDGVDVRPDGSLTWVGVKVARQFANNLVGIPGIAHIAALASTARRSHYSNYGSGITICAPTNNTHEYHRMIVPGLGITTATGAIGGITDRFGGTSSATPLVAAVAALVVSANPGLSAIEVISILKRTAAKDLDGVGYARTPPAGFDPDTSWDISPIAPFDRSDFTNGGDPDGTWSPWFGHGRVDARAAVAEAQRLGTLVSGEPLRYTSSPARGIPDNDVTGIQDVVHVSEAGAARDVRATLDIAHTWIGDLRVRLIAPDGTSVVLHDRAGSGAHDLSRTYTSADVPGLATLRNRSVTGDWTLGVQDLAAEDVGVFRSWRLELDVVAAAMVAEDTQSVRIPDGDATGITRTLDLPTAGTIGEVAVSVDITHPWIGDLQVTLSPPSGAAISLHDRAGGSADNIVRTWRSQDLPALAALRGASGRGTWRLKVADVEARDEGKLNRWRVEVSV
jgi:subtilisin-like proprotein convertase family protein/subtilisin family serine protease